MYTLGFMVNNYEPYPSDMPSPYGSIPPAPRPSQDAGIRDSMLDDASLDAGQIPPISELDIFTLSPKAALRLFTCAVSSTLLCNQNKSRGAPPTPPISSPTTPNNTVSFVEQASMMVAHDAIIQQQENPRLNEIPRHHRTPIGSPEAQPHDNPNAQPPLLEIDEDYTEYEKQCLRMARLFYSKKPPEITLEEYLKRIHVYCAMSTGVYLAAACYIQRITGMLWTMSAQDENRHPSETTKYVYITPKSAHRLALAALRLAHKAMEDNTWAHKRFAMVGGVPNANLTRLEIALSYLLDFKLYCPNDELLEAAKSIVRGNPDLVAKSGLAL